MLSNNLNSLIKSRIISSIVDILIFCLLLGISFAILIDKFQANIWLLLYPILFYIFYFSFLPKVTNGYTIAGYLFGIKIIKLDGGKIALIEYIIRSIYSIGAYFYFLGYVRVKVNAKGQFFFDKPFNISVKNNISLETDNNQEYIYYSFME